VTSEACTLKLDISVNESLQVLAAISVMVALLAVPVLSTISCRIWVNIIRGDIPRWRSTLGIASIFLTILSWVAFVTPILLHMLRMDSALVGVDWDEVVLLLIIAGSILALTLKRSPRIFQVTASLLMYVLWIASARQ
jgi:hypothetical protein